MASCYCEYGVIVGADLRLAQFLGASSPFELNGLPLADFIAESDREHLEAVIGLAGKKGLQGSVKLSRRDTRANYFVMPVSSARTRIDFTGTEPVVEDQGGAAPLWLDATLLYPWLSSETQRAQRYGSPLSVLVLELQPHTGVELPQATRQAVTALKRSLRATDGLCQYSARSFVAVLPQTSREGAATLAARIESLLPPKAPHPLISFAQWRDGQTPYDLLQEAVPAAPQALAG